MEPEGSLPHSQFPATCPYLGPDQSGSCPPSHFLKILPSTPVFQVGSFPQVSPPELCIHLSSPPYVTPCIYQAPFVPPSLLYTH